jgi:hypothetical protein
MTTRDYEIQLHTMRHRFEAWCREHPDKTADFQFNFPPNVAVVSTIREAIRLGFVSVNIPARELIEAMCDSGTNEPTVLMVRAVIEA